MFRVRVAPHPLNDLRSNAVSWEGPKRVEYNRLSRLLTRLQGLCPRKH